MDTQSKITGLNGLANVTTGVCIFVMAPILLGMTSMASVLGCMPWMLCAMPILIIAVILLFVNGDVVGGTANAILTGIALFNNIWHAARMLYAQASGIEIGPEVTQGIYMMDGCGYLAAAIFLMSVVWISSKVNLVQALFVCFPTVGFILLFCVETLGMNLGIIPGCCLVVFACWLIYSGIAMMLHAGTGVQIMPYIIAPKQQRQ